MAGSYITAEFSVFRPLVCVSPAENPCRCCHGFFGSSPRPQRFIHFRLSISQSSAPRRDPSSFLRVPGSEQEGPMCNHTFSVHFSHSLSLPPTPWGLRHSSLFLVSLWLLTLHAFPAPCPHFRRLASPFIIYPFHSFSLTRILFSAPCWNRFFPPLVGFHSAGPRALPASTLVELSSPSVVDLPRLPTVAGRIRRPSTRTIHGVRGADTGGGVRSPSSGARGIRGCPPVAGAGRHVRRRSATGGRVWRRRPAVPGLPPGSAARALDAEFRRCRWRNRRPSGTGAGYERRVLRRRCRRCRRRGRGSSCRQRGLFPR